MTKLLHIGLGKCGSTVLQREIFPRLAKKLNATYTHHLYDFLILIKSYLSTKIIKI